MSSVPFQHSITLNAPRAIQLKKWDRVSPESRASRATIASDISTDTGPQRIEYVRNSVRDASYSAQKTSSLMRPASNNRQA